MIVGKKILDTGLIRNGSEENLKHSTYDLTIGEILPIGKEAALQRRKGLSHSPYYLEPREMIWILSKEEFGMKGNVTGLATLRTTFTKDGILALNVGIIDPFFEGPISTALINFSDRPRRIAIGDKFFRVVFFDHEDVSEYHQVSENIPRERYLSNLEDISNSDFSRSFLNIPEYDDDFYHKRFWRILWNGAKNNKSISIPASIFILAILLFQINLGVIGFYVEFLKRIKNLFF